MTCGQIAISYILIQFKVVKRFWVYESLPQTKFVGRFQKVTTIEKLN